MCPQDSTARDISAAPVGESPPAALVEEVRSRFHVGPHFSDAYLRYWFRARERRYPSLEAILGSPEPLPMWFTYAMTANWRGEQILSMIEPETGGRPGRYLDVGCGLGGCLTAFAKRGYEVVGIEIDAERVALAKANGLDHGLADCAFEASILEPGLPERLGRFDVITMIDVIEHVLDVPLALSRAVELLNPGGLLLLEIPNKDSLGAVAQDGHFSLFGITQLERPDAVELHRRFFDFEYDVGDYYELGRYRVLLDDLGCDSKLIHSPYIPPRRLRETSGLVGKLARSWRAYRRGPARRLPSSLRRTIGRRVGRYLLGFAGDALSLPLRRGRVPAFKERYLLDFWTLIARRRQL